MEYDEEKYGKKIEYDPQWEGPLFVTRYSTDKIWLIVFSIFCVIFLAAGSFSLIGGNISKITNPSDDVGRVCGVDKEVKDKPYLVYMDLKDLVPKSKGHKSIGSSSSSSHKKSSFETYDGIMKQPASACVTKCPTENFLYVRNSAPLDSIREKLICTTEINKALITSFDQIDALIYNKKCAKWYLQSEAIDHECIKASAWAGHESETITENDLRKIYTKPDQSYTETFKKMFKGSLVPSVVSIIIGGILAIVYVVLLKWYAVPFVYATIVMMIGLMTVGIYFLAKMYAAHKENQGALFGVIILSILVVCVILLVIFFRKKIYLACQMIKESSKAVTKISMTLFFPIIPCIFYLILLIFCVAAFASLTTISNPSYSVQKIGDVRASECSCASDNTIFNGAKCNPKDFLKTCNVNGQACLMINCRQDGVTSPGYLYLFHAINIFGFYWIAFFIAAIQILILGGSFGAWYWSFDKSNLGNSTLFTMAGKMLRYHLGTAALGSLILAIVQMIRMLVEALQKKANESNNMAIKLLMCCIKCIFEILEAIINFITYNAYIMCAIHGKGFVSSAKSSFNLIKRNILKVFVVNTITSWLFTMAAIMITILILLFLHLYATYINHNLPVGAFIISGIGTFIISSAFFSVHSTAVDTIFLCFLEDTERNDGSRNRPFYMNNKLKTLLDR